MPKIKHVKMMKHIQTNSTFGLQLATKCQHIKKFSQLFSPTDFQTVLNYVQALSNKNEVEEVEILCDIDSPPGVLVMFMDEISRNCSKLKKLAIKNKMLAQYLPSDCVDPLKEVLAKVSALDLDCNEALFNCGRANLNPNMTDFTYFPHTQALISPFSLCQVISNSMQSLVKLAIKAPFCTIKSLKVLSNLHELLFTDDTDSSVIRIVPINQMRSHPLIASAPEAFREFMKSASKLVRLDLRLSVFNLERVDEVIEIISEDGQNLKHLTVNVRHDILAGGEVAPLMATLTKLRSICINESIMRPWNLDIILRSCAKLRQIQFREYEVDTNENQVKLVNYAKLHPRRKITSVIAKASFAYTIEDNGKQFKRETVRVGNSKIIDNLIINRLIEI
ncbi:hypothetical protein HDE_00284 [Halotydeus destructor]|nr:hypothetical protein HDE_00284 [Halotydeus destructor]